MRCSTKLWGKSGDDKVDDDVAFVQGGVNQSETDRNHHDQLEQLIASRNNEMHKPPENIAHQEQHRDDQKKPPRNAPPLVIR